MPLPRERKKKSKPKQQGTYIVATAGSSSRGRKVEQIVLRWIRNGKLSCSLPLYREIWFFWALHLGRGLPLNHECKPMHCHQVVFPYEAREGKVLISCYSQGQVKLFSGCHWRQRKPTWQDDLSKHRTESDLEVNFSDMWHLWYMKAVLGWLKRPGETVRFERINRESFPPSMASPVSMSASESALHAAIISLGYLSRKTRRKSRSKSVCVWNPFLQTLHSYSVAFFQK